MRRKSLEHAICPIARSLDCIGDWWSLLIVRDAFIGRRRFTEFQQSLGLARNILATRLRKLVERGIFRLEPASDGSKYREYVLTEKGRSLRMVVAALRVWGTQWMFADSPQLSSVRDAVTGEEIVGFGFQSRGGRFVVPSELKFPTTPPPPSPRPRRVAPKPRSRSR
jgi:DNA-binding HxlR family transcriptional regulator